VASSIDGKPIKIPVEEQLRGEKVKKVGRDPNGKPLLKEKQKAR